MPSEDEPVVSCRLTSELARGLETVAATEGQSVEETVRLAIEIHVAARRLDAAFQEELARTVEHNRKVFEELRR